MIIAMTYLNEEIFPHFGKSEYFVVYEVENKEVKSKKIYQLEGSGHASKAAFLKEMHADVLICGGMGMHAKEAIDSVGVSVYAGQSGNTDEVLKEFLEGKLIANELAIHSCCH